MLLFFSVARSAQNSQAGRANEAQTEDAAMADSIEEGEKMPTDKLVDVSPLGCPDGTTKNPSLDGFFLCFLKSAIF